MPASRSKTCLDEYARSPFALGVVTALQFLPVLLLSLIGGVITDRWSKHRLVIITQMAALLHVSDRTIHHHIEHIYDKIDVSTRAGATLFAMQHNLLRDLDDPQK